MDWADTGYAYDVVVSMVHQTNVNMPLGLLSGVQLEDIKIVENYYSDSRVQASVSTLTSSDSEGDGYIKNARLRITMRIPERGWSEELVTGYVSDIQISENNGYVKKVYTIEGTIWGLLNHKIKEPITISSGAQLVSTWRNILSSQTRMQFETNGAEDHSYGSTVVYEAGSNLSTVLFEMSSGYDRMDVNGHGVITLSRYLAPSNRVPSRIIDFNDLKGLAILPFSSTDSEHELPGRAIVTATISETDGEGNSTQKTLVGSYDAPSTDKTSIDVRGWLNGRTDGYVGQNENPTIDELNDQAKKNWKEAQTNSVEYQCTSVFADYHAGDVVTVFLPSGTKKLNIRSKKMLISSVRTTFDSFTQELTLKEV